jgi:hypothetical protein
MTGAGGEKPKAGDHPLLVRAGTFALGAGFAMRLLMLDDIHPVAEAGAIGFLLLGSGLLLLDLALRGGAAATTPILLLPLLLVWAARSLEPHALKRAIDAWAACTAGFALRGLARDRALAVHVRGALASGAVGLCLFALAQFFFLRDEAAKVAEELAHAITHTELGRAFLASWRSPATCISPNAFAGLLLLAGLPLVFAAGRAIASGAVGPVRIGAAVLGVVVLGGFAVAASAGATLAAAAGILVFAWLGARGRARTGLGIACAVLALAAAGVVIAAATGSELSGKLRTLQERIDYHRAGLRLLGASWPGGTGLELAGRRMMSVTAPGEAFSRSIHDWWLQGLVEGGIAWLPVAAVLAWALARGIRRALAARPLETVEPGEAGRSRVGVGSRASWWWGGLAAGLCLALLLEPMVSVLPYSFGPKEVLAAATAVVFAAVAIIARRLPLGDPAFVRGLAAGCLAFALHGFIDFDLWVPNVMITFAAALALLLESGPAGDAPKLPSRLARGLTAAYGMVNVLAPCAVLLLAESREHVH